MNLSLLGRALTSTSLVAVAVVFTACGAPSDAFVGQWHGSVQTNAATCTGSAQAAAPGTTTEDWLVASTATGIQLATQNFCATIAATVSGSVATITQTGSNCSGSVNQTYTITGSFTASGKALTGAYTVHATDSTMQGACDIPVVVTMTKQ